MKQLVLTLLALIIVSTAAIGQTTYYVSTTGDDVTGNGTEGNPWQTIQYAIGQSDGGDIIQVAVGTYTETLVIDKSITINGEVNGDERPVIRPGAPPAKHNNEEKIGYQAIISISLRTKPIEPDNVSISGIEIDGQDTEYYKHGIRAMWTDVKFNDVIIRNIRSSGSVSGIWIENGSSEITGCTITDIEAVAPINSKGYYGTVSGIVVVNSLFGKENTGKDEPSFPIKIAENIIERIEGGDTAGGISVTSNYSANIYENSIDGIESKYFAFGINISKPHISPGKSNKGDAMFHIFKNDVSNVKSTLSGEFKKHDKPGGWPSLEGSFGIQVSEHQNVSIDNNNIEDIISQGALAMGIMVDGRTFNDGPFPPPKGDSNIEISGNEVLNVFGKQPPINGNGNDFLPVGSACIGVFGAGNTKIADNTVSQDFLDLENSGPIDYDLFVGILVNTDGENIIYNNIVQMMVVGIYGFSPSIDAENNTIYNGGIGIVAANRPLGFFFLGTRLNNALADSDLARLINNEQSGANNNNRFFTEANWHLHGNTVSNKIYGVMVLYEADFGRNDAVSLFQAKDNTVKNNYDAGFFIYEDGGLTTEINQNTIRNNVTYGISYNSIREEYQVDGRFNFWGSEDPPPVSNGILEPGSGNAVTPNVKYAPWLGAKPRTTPMTYFVDDTGSIQDAIDMAQQGEIIRILGGEYEGDVNTAGKDGITLYPGDSPACVTFTGKFDVTAKDTLRIDIAGTTVCKEYTRLSVLGQVNLNGIKLDIRLGFIPQLEDEFDIVVSNNPINGKFEQEDEVVVEYQDQEVRVTFSIAYLNDRGDNKVVLTVTGIDSTAVPIGNLALFVAMGLMVLFFVITGLKQRTSRA